MTQVDPGQLSRVLANRGDLSMKVLQKVLEVLMPGSSFKQTRVPGANEY